VCLFGNGVARAFVQPAKSSLLPLLVSRSRFANAVTWATSGFQLSSVVGPALGGLLIAATGGAVWVYVLDAGLSLVFILLFRRIAPRPPAATTEPIGWRSLLAGAAFVWRTKLILGAISLDMFAVLLGGATALLPIYAKEILGVGPAGLGWLRTAMPMGAVSCALILAHRPPMQKAGRALLWSVAAFGLATVVFGLSRWYWLSFAMLLVCGAVDNVSVVVRHTLVQILTPDEKRGRVSAVNSLFIGTSNELGEVESGTVAHLFGPAIGNALSTGATISVVTGGIGTVAVVVAVAWIWPTIRRYGRLDSG
jgi:MFS family permease